MGKGTAMALSPEVLDKIRQAVNRDRLLSTARKLIDIPSPTCEAKAALDELHVILADAGFRVERPVAGWEKAPAVAARLETGRPGRVLQFNGHLDTVHLPFAASAVAENLLKGSGASDMKAGIAAATEAMHVLRETQLLPGGSVLFTAHDLHEAPWGDASQLNRLIDEGYIGDGVLIPEYIHDRLPVIGRGNAQIEITISRPGAPVHEVFRPPHEPNVVAVGALTVQRILAWDQQLATTPHPVAGAASAFVGQIHSGEIYNQYPQTCRIQGTIRWLPGQRWEDVYDEYRRLTNAIAKETGAMMETRFNLIRDAFQLDVDSDLATDFMATYSAVSGTTLPVGPKPFVDDGSCFWQKKGIPVITHGPQAGGAHTTEEWVTIEDLIRVANVYAATAVLFCT
jgi:acetylornithine deacetylase/succinyl-diaminopimelate desuccinylase-like protein